MKKGLDERIDKGILYWFSHVERMERDRIAKRVYVGESAGSQSVGGPQKRWIDTEQEYLKKRGLDIRQARRMVQDMSEWLGIEGECMGRSPGDESLSLMRGHSYMRPLKVGSPSVA